MDYEELLEKAIDEINSSRENLWGGAQTIHQLFSEHGRFEAEFMQIIAEQTHRGPDTIYHLRKAWQIRTLLSEADPMFFHCLPISFYYKAYDFLDRLSVEDIAFWMEAAATEKKSIRWFAANLASVAGEETNVASVKRSAAGTVRKLIHLQSDAELSGMPPATVRRLGFAAKLVERAMQ